MSTAKLEVIQGLRGVAALMVVLLHFKVFLAPVAPQFSRWLDYGYLGVDIFFIISGFIIYVSTENPESRDGRSFLLRRFCRVVLPAWAAMLLAVVAQPPYLRDLIHGIFFIPLKNIDPPFYGHSFLIVAWTLTYELVFYLIFAAALLSRAGRRHRGLLVSGVLVVLVCLGQTRGCCTLDAQQAPLFAMQTSLFPSQMVSLLGNPMLLEFVIGIALAWAYVNRWFERIAPHWLLLTAPLVLYLILSFQFVAGHGLTRAGVLAGAMVFYALCLQAWRDHRAQQASAVTSPSVIWACVYLGEISYSLYLVHPSVKAVLLKVARLAGLQPAGWGIFALAMLCTTLLAHLFYRSVEMPSQRMGRRLAASRHAPAIGADASLRL